MTVLITKLAQSNRRYTTVNGGTHLLTPPPGIKAGALALFAVMGIPQAVSSCWASFNFFSSIVS
jgi:solute carrier family 45 protein 1/2/4